MTTEPAPSHWIHSAPGTALAAMPAVVGILVGSILLGQPAAGVVATAAAVTLGFGAFKRIHGSAGPAMGLAAAGMGASAFVGTLAGQYWEAMILVTVVWGFGTGLLPTLKSDLSWVGQQSTIVLLVAGAFPGPVSHAADRALLVLGGSAVQFACITALVWLLSPATIHLPPGWTASARAAGEALTTEVRSRSAAVGRAVRLAIVLAFAVEVWRWLHLQNGYWLGMTVLLLVRPDFRDTIFRAGERILGTIAGALLATLLVHALPAEPSRWIVAGLTAPFAFLTLTFQQGNRLAGWSLSYPGSYAVFAGCLTAYVVFLLDFGNLSPHGVVEQRILLTLLGGVLSLAVHIPLANSPRPAEQPTPQPAG